MGSKAGIPDELELAKLLHGCDQWCCEALERFRAGIGGLLPDIAVEGDHVAIVEIACLRGMLGQLPLRRGGFVIKRFRSTTSHYGPPLAILPSAEASVPNHAMLC